MKKKPKKYSVLLLYPDYMSDNFGQETYYAHVEAIDRDMAVHNAQHQAQTCEGNESCDNPEDFHPLLVLEGWHHGL